MIIVEYTCTIRNVLLYTTSTSSHDSPSAELINTCATNYIVRNLCCAVLFYLISYVLRCHVLAAGVVSENFNSCVNVVSLA